jgi:hypothetical protein
MSRSKSLSPACPLASGWLATFCGGQFDSMASQAFSDLSLRRVLHSADPTAPGYCQEILCRLRRHGDRRHCVSVLHRNKSSTKLLRVELCIGIRVLCMLNAYSCAYAIQAATGQVVWPRLDSCMPCTCICHACRYRAVTRATWRHAPVHAHVHEQCSSSLRGLDICISRKRDIT